MAPNNTLPIWGNEKTMNLNTLILTNIQSSPYFKVNLYELKTYHEAIDEIYYKVSHLEPWEKGSRKTAGQTGMCGGVRGVGAGGIVSSAYCLLYKLFTLRLTRKQLQGLLDHSDSPYIRGLGFMYIRYTQDPKYFWEWYEPYLDDEEPGTVFSKALKQSHIMLEIDVKAGGGHTITIGEMLRQWLVKLEWYSTLFPRIPVPVQKDIDVKMRARIAEKFRQFQEEVPSVQQQTSAEAQEDQHQPRHIADDEVSFGEAEKYATNAAIRKRSPTPPYRSRPRTPPPRRRTPPPRHRSPPRHRAEPYKRPRSRSRSPRRGGSASDDYSRELQRERERQNRDRDRRSRSRDRDHKSHHDRVSESRKRVTREDNDDDDPINFAKNMIRQKELREREFRVQHEKKSRGDDESDDDDDPINFAKKLLKRKEEQQQQIRERELALQKKAEGSKNENNKDSSKHSKSGERSDRHKHKKSSKEHKRKRSRSRERDSKKSRQKSSRKHRSRSRSRERKEHKEHKERRGVEV